MAKQKLPYPKTKSIWVILGALVLMVVLINSKRIGWVKGYLHGRIGIEEEKRKIGGKNKNGYKQRR